LNLSLELGGLRANSLIKAKRWIPEGGRLAVYLELGICKN